MLIETIGARNIATIRAPIRTNDGFCSPGGSPLTCTGSASRSRWFFRGNFVLLYGRVFTLGLIDLLVSESLALALPGPSPTAELFCFTEDGTATGVPLIPGFLNHSIGSRLGVASNGRIYKRSVESAAWSQLRSFDENRPDMIKPVSMRVRMIE